MQRSQQVSDGSDDNQAMGGEAGPGPFEVVVKEEGQDPATSFLYWECYVHDMELH